MFMPSIFGENLFDDFFNDLQRPARPLAPAQPHNFFRGNANLMRTDVKEDEKAFTVEVELPGYNKEDVKVELKDGCLKITGEKTEDTEENTEAGKYIRRERFFGSCSRSFYIGEDVTKEDIKAKFDNGVLSITVPKLEKKPEIEQNHFIAIEG